MKNRLLKPAAAMVIAVVSAIAAVAAFLLTGCSFGTDSTGDKYAFLFGIADYSGYYWTYPGDKDLSLNYTDDDAEDLAALLESQGWTVNLRIDGGDEASGALAATRGQFEEDAAWAAENLTPEDTVLFYVSSHGTYLSGGDTGEADGGYDEWVCLFSESFSLNDYDSYGNVCVSDDTMGEWLSLIDARKIVIIDACNSGGFIGTQAVIDGIDYDPEYDTQGTLYGRPLLADSVTLFLSFPSAEALDTPASTAFLLTAAGELEESLETSSLEHGIFTYLLLAAGGYYTPGSLPGDLDSDGYVTLLEAYSYAEEELLPLYDYYDFLPRVSGTSVDIVLFSLD